MTIISILAMIGMVAAVIGATATALFYKPESIIRTEYKGYILIQYTDDWHCSILDSVGKPVIYISCDEPLTKQGANMCIKHYLELIKAVDEAGMNGKEVQDGQEKEC